MVRIIVASLLAVLTSACAASVPEHQDDGLSIAVDTSAEIRLPVDDYALDSIDLGRLDLARNIVIQRCVKEFGLEPETKVDKAEARRSIERSVNDLGLYGNKRRYGLADQRTASRDGYHLTADRTADRTATTPGDTGRAQDPVMYMVLMGRTKDGRFAEHYGGRRIPAGGCVGRANLEVFGRTTAGEAKLVAEVGLRSYQRSEADAEVVATAAAWSKCMRDKGFAYAGPGTAGQEFDLTSAAPSPEEIAVATADVACKQQTRLVEIWHRVETALQKAEVEQQLKAFQAIRKERDEQVRRATGIIVSST